MDQVVNNEATQKNVKQDKSKQIKITKVTHDYEALNPFFGWLPINIIKKTFKNTTQYANNTYECIP